MEISFFRLFEFFYCNSGIYATRLTRPGLMT